MNGSNPFSRASIIAAALFRLSGGMLVSSISLSGQQDTALHQIQLQETLVRSERFQYSGYSHSNSDTFPDVAVLSLAEQLSRTNGLSVRFNAPGTLATLSCRGAGPNHTAVFWNGWNLQNPMNGVVDASLLPLWAGDQVQLVRGGYSAAQSSGAMGGAVEINTPGFPEQSKAEISVGAGSFGNRNVQAGYSFISNRYSGSFRGNYAAAENNFPYPATGLDGSKMTRYQENNFGQVLNLQQANQWRPDSKNVVRTAGWLQRAYRQIPPSNLEAASERWQKDHSLRLAAQWSHEVNKRNRILSDAAWIDELIDFRFAGQNEISRSRTAGLKSEWRSMPDASCEWRSGLSLLHISAGSDGYNPVQAWYRQARLAGFASVDKTWFHRLKFSAVVREEWAEKQGIPFTWSLSTEYRTWATSKFRGHLSRNFNLPTFNDRYWNVLGNPELRPERGYSADMGWDFSRGGFTAGFSLYQILLNDWILWSPGPDGLFRPGNLRQVRGRGLEASAGYAWRPGKWRIQCQGRGQWSDTRNTRVYAGAQSSLDRQLPYTPNFSMGGDITAVRGPFTAVYMHQITGRRYITSDNAGTLDAFQTGNLMVQWTFNRHIKRKPAELKINLEIKNLWNQPYQWLVNQPMPGRSWNVSIYSAW